MPDAQEWIQHPPGAFQTVELNAHSGDLHRKDRRVWPFLGAALDGFVRHEPGVAAAPAVGFGAVPAAHIALVLILHPDCQPVQGDIARFGQMEDVLVGVVDKAAAVDRFVVTHRDIAADAGVAAHVFLLNGDGLDPVNDILQGEVLAQFEEDFERSPGIRGFATYIEKDRTLVAQDLADDAAPFAHPANIVGASHGVVVALVASAEVVGR